MASSNIKYTYTDKNGEVRPTAAVAREQLRRQQGLEADTSFDETLSYFGYNSDTTPETMLATSAQLRPVKEKTTVSDLKSNVIDKIASGENSYYDAADAMEKPSYESQYDAQISGLVDKILNGEKFSYDINADAVYQQYKEQYERSAKKSADNAMSSAMAASGGYANSYAQAAAQQAYNAEMQNLGEMIPEFEAQAYSRYADERSDQYNQLSTLMSAENMAYGKYRDDVSDFYSDREYQLGMGDRYNTDLYNQANLYQSVEDSDFNKEMTLEEFNFNKEQYANDVEYQKAAAAADMGNFELMGDYLGVDTSEAEKWYNISKATELYSATGIIGFLDDAGIDTTELREQMQDEKFYNQLTTNLAIYEATGDPSKLNEMGIDTSISDELLKYSVVAAKNEANGSSGSGGSGTSSSGSGSGNYSNGGGNSGTTETYTAEVKNILQNNVSGNYNSPEENAEAYIDSLINSGSISESEGEEIYQNVIAELWDASAALIAGNSISTAGKVISNSLSVLRKFGG